MLNNTRDVRRRGGLPARGSLVALASLLVAVLAAGCGSSGTQAPPGAGIGSSGAGEGGSGQPGSQGSGVSQAPRSATAAALSGVGGGALFGGDVPLLAEQPQLGRKLAIVRDYYRIGESFPDVKDRQAMAAGSTLLVSLDSVPRHGGPSYAAIVAGQYDRTILTFLKQVEQAAVNYRLSAIYVAFEHEADSKPHAQLGSPAEFIAAWDHIHHLAAAAHLDWNTGGRLHWVWILTTVAFRSGYAAWDHRPGPSTYWPGTGEVDIVAADGYNADGCRSAQQGSDMVANGTRTTTPAQLFGPVVDFAQAHGGLPVFIAEWGSVPYTSDMQAEYIDQMRAYVTATPEIAAAMYWNGHGQRNGCDYSVDNHPASIAALAAMGHSAGLQGHIASAG
jgi:hypothetical protein